MKLKAGLTLLLSGAFVAAGIAVTMATGLWQTSGAREPRTLDAQTAQEAGAAQGTYDPADIRGSYTFGKVASLYGVPLTDLAEGFGLPQGGEDAFQVKTLETLNADGAPEIGTASVRLFVACYLGLPYEPAEDTYLPARAAQILAERGRMSADQAAYVQTHTAP